MAGLIRNATIESTFLGFEEHAFFTCYFSVDYDGSGQVVPAYVLGQKGEKDYTGAFIRRILEVVGVDRWEHMKGAPIRVRCEGVIKAIGNFRRDEWLNLDEFFKQSE